MISALQETGIQLQKGKTALLIAPYMDRVTSVSSIVERALIDYLQSEGMTVLTLEGEEATYENLEKILKPPLEHGFQMADLIVYTGHGLDDAWLGQQPKERPLLTADEAGLLHDSIVVAISCNTLKYLGNVAVTKKARAYLGFTDLVLCPITDELVADRNYKADFIRTFMHPIVTLVQGRTVADAVKEFQDLCYYYADMYGTKRFLLWEFHAFAMIHNANNFSYAGRPDVRL